MNLVSVENLAKSYGEKALFEGVTFGIDSGEKIGLLGINGTGKSTILKTLAGVEEADEGQVVSGRDLRIGYLSQNPAFDDQATVLQQVFRDAAGNYEDWQLESEAKTILTKLGVINFGACMGTLSGGQRKRVALATTLLEPADLLILDEPTNQLDYETVDWLEQYLNKNKCALVLVTHDRYFLDRVVNRIMELDQGRLYNYPGNYSSFLELKQKREEQLLASESKRQTIIRKEMSWIKRGAKARSTKQKARIERFERLQQAVPNSSPDQAEISMRSARLGKKVIGLQHISKAFTGEPLIRDFSYIFSRFDRIGIVGRNGIGKSTLLRLIAGELAPDNGVVEWGSTVKMGIFDQETTAMDGSLKVIDYISEVAEFLPTAEGGLISASQMLERFLFPAGQQFNLIEKLSGGEKRRLYLLHILMGSPNVLLLDEPTNDLDIQTLTILEDFLDDFAGVVVTVSHDRYFLDRVVDKIFAFAENGTVIQHAGAYTEYRDFQKRLAQYLAPPKTAKSRKTAGKPERQSGRPLKMSYKDQQEYSAIEDQIAELESELQEVGRRINQVGSNYLLLQDLVAQQQDLQGRLEARMERWVELSELAEKINESREEE